MTDLRYNTSKLFKAAFGINSPVFITQPFLRNAPENVRFKNIETLPEYYPHEHTSWMGTPILFSASFLGNSYKRYKENGEIERVQLDQLQLPPATMFSFRRAKNITKTNVLGNSGTVKEIFGFDDWIIDVKGLCLDEPNRSAHEQLEALLQFENLADSIDIAGSEFLKRSIHRVAISDWSDNIVQGKAGVIAFQCQMMSDEPLELVFDDFDSML